MDIKGYFYGVMLGDGMIGISRNLKKTKEYPYLGLKAIDLDFVTYARDCIQTMSDKPINIFKNKAEGEKRKPTFAFKCHDLKLVQEVKDATHDRTIVPNYVMDGTLDIKKSFLQGLMDSEGWVHLSLSPIKMCNMGIHFANTSNWTKDVWHMFKQVGVEVSAIHRRKFKDGRKELLWFKINFLDYMKAELSFNIQRKKKRLDFIARIFRDYMCEYKSSYRDVVEDIVQPKTKVIGNEYLMATQFQ